MRTTGFGTAALAAAVGAALAWGAAAGAVSSAVAAAAGGEGEVAKAPGKAPDAKEAFERMKKTLVGTWEEVPGDESPKATVTYRLTSAGSVLQETLFPGAEHEMVSMYHMDGDALVLTHYCALGNQPKMQYDPAASTADSFHFAFAGGTNFDPATDPHIHEGTIGFRADGNLEGEWVDWAGGKRNSSVHFVVEKKPAASAP